ncbi:MAG: TrkH family potassium uptake protein [Bacteroidales bacterium]|nr:TrkH family potassium uptake protein [Bacteroidales bacterium]MDP3003696.1 TrkH family potassium uptake protein [Bacteroidales bacterium]
MNLINPLLILRILSTILLIETISYFFCLPVVFIYKESPYPFLWSAAITILISGVFYFVSRKADTKKFSNRDGYLAVTLSWVVFSLLGALPYLISGTIPSFIDAFFESTSGFSTTGSSILKDVEILPYSILFWRSLTHWFGGIGIIVLVIIILPSLRVTGYQLFSLESSLKEKIHPKTKAIGFRILFIYLGLTLAEIVLLNIGEMNLFDSICHSFGTIATGGFSTKNISLMYYSSYSQYIVMIFMFLAGTSQVIYYYLVKLNFKKIRQNEELWFYIVVAIMAGAIATIILLVNSTRTFEESFRDGFFQIISILTCTGFASADYMLWPLTAVLLIFVLMFAGGSTGSTSGGIKMARHLIVLKNIKNAFLKLNHPKSISSIKLNGKSIAENTNISILSFVVLYLFLFVIGTIIVVVTGVDPVTASSSVATCMGGIGPGLGTVGPMSNFAHMPEASKVVLSLLMIIGRLEIITVFTIFTRTFWKL